MLLLFLLHSSSVDAYPTGDLWWPGIPFDVSNYSSITKGNNFKILQLTDLHICCANAENVEAIALADKLINEVKPDIIVLTGDSVCETNNLLSAELLTHFLDTFEIPYAIALGNHDGEGVLLNQYIAQKYSEGKYSLFKTGPGSIHGYSNYAINLVGSQGNVVYSLILIDSNRYRDYSSSNSGYDYIYPDQIAWYEWYVKQISILESRTVPSLLFYHIPIPEINEVRAEMTAKDPDAAKDAFRENPCPPSQNTGLFKKILELNSTTHMFFGHDHKNMVDYEYKGVHFVYGTKTGPSSYHDDDRMGGTLITVGQSGEVKVEFIIIK